MEWYEVVGLIASVVSIVSAFFAVLSWIKSRKNKNATEKMRDDIYKKFVSLNDVQLMNEINLTIKSITERSFGKNRTTSSVGKSGFNDVLQLLNKIKSQQIYNQPEIAKQVNKGIKILKSSSLTDDQIIDLTDCLTNISRIIDTKERSK